MAMAYNSTLSVILLSDTQQPSDEQSELLASPWLTRYFVSNPSMAHPKVTAFPTIKSLYSTDLELELHRQVGLTTARRSQLMCVNGDDTRYGRLPKVTALRANGFSCLEGVVPVQEYYRGLTTSTFLFAPVGNGNNERKWIEAATLGAIILTDEVPSLAPLLAGIPCVFVRTWANVTNVTLKQAATKIQRSWRSYDRMKTFWPQWLYRLYTGDGDLWTAADGVPLAAPYIIY